MFKFVVGCLFDLGSGYSEFFELLFVLLKNRFIGLVHLASELVQIRIIVPPFLDLSDACLAQPKWQHVVLELQLWDDGRNRRLRLSGLSDDCVALDDEFGWGGKCGRGLFRLGASDSHDLRDRPALAYDVLRSFRDFLRRYSFIVPRVGDSGAVRLSFIVVSLAAVPVASFIVVPRAFVAEVLVALLARSAVLLIFVVARW